LGEAIRQLESAMKAKGLPGDGDYREYYLHWEADESPNNVMILQMGLKENAEKESETSASAKPAAYPRAATLDGIPKIGYGIRMCPFPGSLESAMRYLGDPQDYDFLMGVTGAAFRRFWDKDDGGNVDLMYLEPEVSKRAFEAIGYDFRVLSAKDKPEMILAIQESIAKGRPVLACGIIGPPECGIVAGYDDDGETLLGFSYFQDASIPGYYRKSKWFEESSWGTGLIVIGEKREKPSPREILVRSLEWAIELERTPRRKDHDFGLAAYDGWANGLEKDEDYPKDDPKVMETRAMVHGDQCAMLEDRREGAKYLRRMAKFAPETAEELTAAADHFESAAKRGETLWPWGDGPASKTELAESDFRRKMAKAVREARAEEERGVEMLEKALQKLKAKPAN
jgi:hypothetical protein